MKLTRSATSVPVVGGLTGVVPLVNVVLLLLLFFLLGSSFVLQPGVSVTLPTSRLQLAPMVNAPVVSILRGNPPRIYFLDQAVSAEELTTKLTALRSPGPEGKLPSSPAGNRSVVIRADRGTPYETVMAVGSRALEAGFNVVLATAPEERPRP